MDERENARASLQAMSLVNSKERTQGFGMSLTPDVSQAGGLRFTSQDTDIQGKVAKSLRCFGEFKASQGGKEPLSRWTERPLLSHGAKNNSHLLPFRGKSCVPGSVLPRDHSPLEGP